MLVIEINYQIFIYQKKNHYLLLKKKKIISIIDYGCAVGGFYNIFQKYFNSKIHYHGLDSEKNVIIEAKKKFKNSSKVKFSKIAKENLRKKIINILLVFVQVF